MFNYDEVDKKLGLKEHQTAILLGISPDKWRKFKANRINRKLYIEQSAEAHLLLDSTLIDELYVRRMRVALNLYSKPKFIEFFEHETETIPTKAATLLGLDYPRYNEYKNKSVSMPRYLDYSIEAHLLIDLESLNKLKSQRGILKCS